MKEIKFRAFDYTHNKMEYDVIPYINKKTGTQLVLSPDDREFPEVLGYAQPNHSEIMQFIGLKDKEGKEIYEGDILNEKEDDCPMEIIWDSKNAKFTADIIKDELEYVDWVNDIIEGNLEIIGNIYQNPELINK